MLRHKARGLPLSFVSMECNRFHFCSVMALQEAKTRIFFYILERSYSSVDSQPPEYVASAPEFCAAPKFASIVGTGNNEREALNRLRYHVKVFAYCLLLHNVHAKVYHVAIVSMLQKQLSVPGAKEPAARYNSLEHYLEVDGGTAEDCEDIIGHLSCTWYA